MNQFVSTTQLRGARAMLGWSLLDLAKAACVSPAAVHAVEGRYPRSIPDGVAGAVRVALETAGAHFIEAEDGHAGVAVLPR